MGEEGESQSLLIAQLTDIHLGFEPDNPDELNSRRLDEAVAAVLALDPLPDLLLATGDLADQGDAASYRRVRQTLAALPFPVLYCLGNHDLRAGFREVFPEVPTADGFIQYVVEDWPLRLVVIDTLEEGRHGGAFCERRARWLDTALGETRRPTLLVLHHPPIATGIDWMTTGPEEAWALRLAAVVSRHTHVVGAVSGHIHRAIVSPWAGTTLMVCPSTAPQVALELKPIDPEVADGRPLIVAEPPGYALHLWRDNALVSHFCAAQSPDVLARYGPSLQPMIRAFAAERTATELP